ncbi:MAG: methylated-DNA--[protein]-cysteine S-methyltransferase [Desulfovermiculus sp.]
MSDYVFEFDTPLGCITFTGTDAGLSRVSFKEQGPKEPESHVPEYMHLAQEQVLEYLQGLRTVFDIPLAYSGTRFQLKVWHALSEIGYGCTASYGYIARRVGNPKASRAVGGANNKNPLPLIIPCHRVVGHDGRLVGYGSGLWRKKWLLELEGVHMIIDVKI